MIKHYAELNSESYVSQVVSIDEKIGIDEHGEYKEILVIGQLKQMYGISTQWIESSPIGKFRYRQASVGDFYDNERDAFISPKVFDSFVLDDEKLEWIPPLPMPELPETDDNLIYMYVWKEELYQEDPTQGWVLVPIGLKEEPQEG